MSENNSESAVENTEETESTATEVATTEQTDESAGTDLKAESRKWEARAKQNKEKADLADSLTEKATELEAKVSELQAALDKAKNEVENSGLVLTRYKVAAKYGVSEEDTDLFLTGTDEDTLMKQAERLSQSSARAPKPVAAQGNRSGIGGLTPTQQGAAAIGSLFN